MMSDEKRGGWFPNEDDPRDWQYGDIDKKTPLPAMVDLTKHLTMFLHQGAAPSCVGNAIAHQIMIEERQSNIRQSIPSRAYIYALARRQHQVGPLQLTGTYPRLAFKAIQKMGCPPEAIWKYDADKDWLNKMPNDKAMRYAMGRQGLQYYQIFTDKSAQIRQALADGHPVAFGTKLFKALYNYRIGDVVYCPPDDEPLGSGHFMCIVGYRGDTFTILNSWRGSEIMKFNESVIEWDKSRDFTVITGWNYLKRCDSI